MSVLTPRHLTHGDHGIQVPLVPVDQYLHIERQLQIETDHSLFLADHGSRTSVVRGIDHGSKREIRRQLGQNILPVPGDLPVARLHDEHVALQERAPENNCAHGRHASRISLGAGVAALNAHEGALHKPKIPGVQDVGLRLPLSPVACGLPLVIKGNNVGVTPDGATSRGAELQSLGCHSGGGRCSCRGCGGGRGGGSVYPSSANTPFRALGLLHADWNLINGASVARHLVLVIRPVDALIATRTGATLRDFARQHLWDLGIHNVQVVGVNRSLARLDQLFLKRAALAIVLQRAADDLNSVPLAGAIDLTVFDTVATSTVGACSRARPYDLPVRSFSLAAARLVVGALLTTVLDSGDSGVVELLGHLIRLGYLGVDRFLKISTLRNFGFGRCRELGTLVPQPLVFGVLIAEITQQRSDQRLRVTETLGTGVALVVAAHETLRKFHCFTIRISPRADGELLAADRVVVTNQHITVFETL
mmetsp:Transcript_29489/g.64813  ORF Transcript_29489/g.64813 Transcript_29489/m.64813 type:complete len:478 (+) Transcript_29489:1710-3143(+)